MVLPLYLHPRLNTEPVENLWAAYNSNLLLSQKVFAQPITGFSYRIYPRLSNKISLIFGSFVHLLATKPMAKQSRASGQLSGGDWFEYRVEF